MRRRHALVQGLSDQPRRRILHLSRRHPALRRRIGHRRYRLRGRASRRPVPCRLCGGKRRRAEFLAIARDELAPHLRANAISPGLIDPPSIEGLLKASGEMLIQSTPMKRLGQPQEVANIVCFRCSEWAGFITAETFHVNGGLQIAS